MYLHLEKLLDEVYCVSMILKCDLFKASQLHTSMHQGMAYSTSYPSDTVIHQSSECILTVT